MAARASVENRQTETYLRWLSATTVLDTADRGTNDDRFQLQHGFTYNAGWMERVQGDDAVWR
jgi:hypothetical protein